MLQLAFKKKNVLNNMLTYLALILAKNFCLRHYKQHLYIGGADWYPSWQNLEKANIFEEQPSKEKGRVLIIVKNKKNRVWNIEASRINLIYYIKHGRDNQKFSIIPLGKSMVYVESKLGQCITYIKNKNRFERRKCKPWSGAQTFVMTDENGKIVDEQNMTLKGRIANLGDKLKNALADRGGTEVQPVENEAEAKSIISQNEIESEEKPPEVRDETIEEPKLTEKKVNALDNECEIPVEVNTDDSFETNLNILEQPTEAVEKAVPVNRKASFTYFEPQTSPSKREKLLSVLKKSKRLSKKLVEVNFLKGERNAEEKLNPELRATGQHPQVPSDIDSFPTGLVYTNSCLDQASPSQVSVIKLRPVDHFLSTLSMLAGSKITPSVLRPTTQGPQNYPICWSDGTPNSVNYMHPVTELHALPIVDVANPSYTRFC